MWLNWPKETSGMERRDLQMHQTILETWDDSDSITAINAQKDLRHSQKWWHNHSEAQYQGSDTNNEHMEIAATELRLETNNPIGLRISNTSS